MEHPLINDADQLTLDQLQSKISDLTKKISMAHRMGNAQLRAQVQLALNTYQAKYQEKLQKEYDKQRGSGPDFSDKIDIS